MRQSLKFEPSPMIHNRGYVAKNGASICGNVRKYYHILLDTTFWLVVTDTETPDSNALIPSRKLSREPYITVRLAGIDHGGHLPFSRNFRVLHSDGTAAALDLSLTPWLTGQWKRGARYIHLEVEA